METIESIFTSNGHLYGRVDIDTYSVCGCGSQLDSSTENLRTNLYSFLKKHKINSIADIPCGDYWWMRYVDLHDISYVGGDIITAQVQKLREKFPDKEFKRLDIRIDKLPDVDLLFCRDCLFHFSEIDKRKALNNYATSGIKYILMSNHPESINNVDIKTGDFGHINWQLAPWSFSAPIDKLYDSNKGYDTKELQLYTREQITNYLR